MQREILILTAGTALMFLITGIVIGGVLARRIDEKMLAFESDAVNRMLADG